MPVTESTQYAKFNTIGLTQRPDSIEAEGRIRYLNDVVTFVGDETTGVAVKLLPLPKGALVDLAKSTVIGPAMSGVSIDLGVNGAETTNMVDGLSLASAGTRVVSGDDVPLLEVTDGALTLTVAGGTPAAVSQRVSIAYYVR